MKKKVLLILIVLVSIVFCFIPGKYNSKYKLDIVSSYGDDESYHPKVLNFKKPWNGYKYYMSYTPYPSGDDRKENPHIVASNDLVTWDKIIDPDRALDEPDFNVPLKTYNSDSHILYNDDTDTMEMYWRFVDDTKNAVYIYRMTSKDGINWSDKTISLKSMDRKSFDYVSPAVLYDNGTYKMWYVGHGLKIYYIESKDAVHWSEEKEINMKYKDGAHSWHLDVIKSDLGYEMLVVAFDKWENHNDMDMYYSKSKDGLNWDDAEIVLKPTRGTGYWDNRGLYRSSFIKENGVYFVFYGGTNTDLHHGLGLVYGKNIHSLKSTNVNFRDKDECEKFSKVLSKELK